MRSRIARFRLLFSLAVVLMILLATALPALAQATDTPTPGEVQDSFIVWLESLFLRGLGGGALVMALTQIIKLFVAPEAFPARYIQLIVAAVVWLIFVLGRSLGFEQADSIYKIAEALAPHVVAIIVSLVTSGGSYTLLRNQGVPFFGYSRSRPSST